MGSSVGQTLNKRLDTLDRRLEYLEKKSYRNSWDLAEIAALHLALDVIERHEDTAREILKRGLG